MRTYFAPLRLCVSLLIYILFLTPMLAAQGVDFIKAHYTKTEHVIPMRDGARLPREPPHVSHARGTEIVVEHIERYLCPSILSVDLTTVVPGSDGPR